MSQSRILSSLKSETTKSEQITTRRSKQKLISKQRSFHEKSSLVLPPKAELRNKGEIKSTPPKCFTVMAATDEKSVIRKVDVTVEDLSKLVFSGTEDRFDEENVKIKVHSEEETEHSNVEVLSKRVAPATSSSNKTPKLNEKTRSKYLSRNSNKFLQDDSTLRKQTNLDFESNDVLLTRSRLRRTSAGSNPIPYTLKVTAVVPSAGIHKSNETNSSNVKHKQYSKSLTIGTKRTLKSKRSKQKSKRSWLKNLHKSAKAKKTNDLESNRGTNEISEIGLIQDNLSKSSSSSDFSNKTAESIYNFEDSTSKLNDCDNAALECRSQDKDKSAFSPLAADKVPSLSLRIDDAEVNKNIIKAKNKQQENQSDPAFDSIETERRLAMEFPRHNWLVKHIMKEKKKKEESQISVGDKSRSSTSKPTSSSFLGAVDATQFNTIGIVKPVQYFKEQSPINRKRSFCDGDQINDEKKRQSCDDISDKQNHELVCNLHNDSCTSSKLKEDNLWINKDFSIIVAPASRETEALDLSTKCNLDLSTDIKNNESKSGFVLDLSRKEEPESKKISEKNANLETVTPQNRQIEGDEVHKTSHRPADSNSISLEEQKPFVVISNVKPLSSKNQSNKNDNFGFHSIRKKSSFEMNQEKSEENFQLFGVNSRENFCTSNTLEACMSLKNQSLNSTNSLMRNGNEKSNSLSSENCNKMLNSAEITNYQTPTQDVSAKNKITINDSSSSPTVISFPETKYFESRKTPVIDVDSIEDDIPIIRPRMSSLTTSSSSSVKSCPPAANNLKDASTSDLLMMASQIAFKNYNKPCSQISSNQSQRQLFSNGGQLGPKRNVDGNILRREHPNQVLVPKNRQHVEKSSFHSQSMCDPHHSTLSIPAPNFVRRFSEPIRYPQSSHLMTSPRKTLTLKYSNPHFSPHLRYPKQMTSSLFSPSSRSLVNRPEFMSSPKKIVSFPAQSITSQHPNYKSPTSISKAPMSYGTTCRQHLSYNNSTAVMNNHQLGSRFPLKPRPICKSQSALTNPSFDHSISTFSRVPSKRLSVGGAESTLLSASLPLEVVRKATQQSYNEHAQNPRAKSMCAPPAVSTTSPLIHKKVSPNHPTPQQKICPQPSIPNLIQTLNLNMLTPRETEHFAAQLKVQKLELENQIHNLKAIEQKIYSSQFSLARTGVRESVLQNQAQRFNAYQSIEKRKCNDLHLMHEIREKQARLALNFPPNSTRVSAAEPSMILHKNGVGNLEERCIRCRAKAYFVCSGCRSVWYCSKPCQLDDWPKHNKICS